MYYKTERQKCTYDKIPKIRLHLWKGNSYNNYSMTRIESVILCFLWWELRTEENSLILRRRSSVVCAESMGGIRSLWHIRYYRCFLFHASNGTGIIMCRWAAAIPYMSWIWKLERRSRGDQVEILPQHLTLVNQGSRGHGYRRCSHCGYETAEDFEFCPKCGNRF